MSIQQKILFFLEDKNLKKRYQEEMAFLAKKIFLFGQLTKEELVKALFDLIGESQKWKEIDFETYANEVIFQMEEYSLINTTSFEDGKIVCELNKSLFKEVRVIV